MNKIMRKQLIILLFLGLTVLSSIASAIDDVKSLSGATDYPGLPRIKDSILIGKNQFAYDIGTFINEIKARKWKTTKAQGARTQLVYFAPSELSLAAVINNYRSAFQQLGDVEELFHCDKNSCLRDSDNIDYTANNSTNAFDDSISVTCTTIDYSGTITEGFRRR